MMCARLLSNIYPPGTSFEDAKAILLGAGLTCRIEATPLRRDHVPWELTPGVVATLRFSSSWYTFADLEIDLFPLSPGDFRSSVSKVSAEIRYATL